MSNCSKCKNLILEPNTTYGINPLAVCRCATVTTPEDTHLREQIFNLMTEDDFPILDEVNKKLDSVMNLITLHTQEAYKKGYIAGGIAHLTNPTEAGEL